MDMDSELATIIDNCSKLVETPNPINKQNDWFIYVDCIFSKIADYITNKDQYDIYMTQLINFFVDQFSEEIPGVPGLSKYKDYIIEITKEELIKVFVNHIDKIYQIGLAEGPPYTGVLDILKKNIKTKIKEKYNFVERSLINGLIFGENMKWFWFGRMPVIIQMCLKLLLNNPDILSVSGSVVERSLMNISLRGGSGGGGGGGGSGSGGSAVVVVEAVVVILNSILIINYGGEVDVKVNDDE